MARLWLGRWPAGLYGCPQDLIVDGIDLPVFIEAHGVGSPWLNAVHRSLMQPLRPQHRRQQAGATAAGPQHEETTDRHSLATTVFGAGMALKAGAKPSPNLLDPFPACHGLTAS